MPRRRHIRSAGNGRALAVAEAENRTGAEFLEALILGYEVLCRVGVTLTFWFQSADFVRVRFRRVRCCGCCCEVDA